MPEPSDAEASSTNPSNDYSIIVLLVDDQAMVGEMVRRALYGEPNLVFHYCPAAGDAMKMAELLRPTVILQDLLLPDIDGLTLLQHYRGNPLTRDIPVIVLSTKEEPAVKRDAFRLGATDYLVKLPDPIELLARIRHHSKAYLNQIQRDQAYRALHESQQQLVIMNIELQRLNSIDGLTGLANRRHLEDYLSNEWKRAIRERGPVSVMMIDVDEFKKYNDSCGHLAGDEGLKQGAATIRQGIERPADLAARFGGEEFLVVLPNTTLGGARHVAENMRRSLSALEIPHPLSSIAPHVTVSIGLATATPVPGDSFATLIAQADRALYEAKKAGRNQVAPAA